MHVPMTLSMKYFFSFNIVNAYFCVNYDGRKGFSLIKVEQFQEERILLHFDEAIPREKKTDDGT